MADAKKIAQIQLRITPEHKAAYETAAKVAGMSLSEWMRDQLNKAANI